MTGSDSRLLFLRVCKFTSGRGCSATCQLPMVFVSQEQGKSSAMRESPSHALWSLGSRGSQQLGKRHILQRAVLASFRHSSRFLVKCRATGRREPAICIRLPGLTKGQEQTSKFKAFIGGYGVCFFFWYLPGILASSGLRWCKIQYDVSTTCQYVLDVLIVQKSLLITIDTVANIGHHELQKTPGRAARNHTSPAKPSCCRSVVHFQGRAQL